MRNQYPIWLLKKQRVLKLFSMSKKTNLADFMTTTSIPSDSSFSIAGYAERKQRSRLSAKNLKYSMVVRDMDTLKKLIKTLNIKSLIKDLDKIN